MRALTLFAALALTAATGIKDRTSMMPLAGRGPTRVVPEHMLNIAKLPGGTLGDYTLKGKTFQLFIIESESNQKAAFLLLDVKAAIRDAEYIPWMGGYSGVLNGKPVFIFAKLQYLAGVVGLPKTEADPVARQLASRLK